MQNLKHIYLILVFSLVFFSLLSLTSSKLKLELIGIKPVDLFSEIRSEKPAEKPKQPAKTSVKAKVKAAPAKAEVAQESANFTANAEGSVSIYSFFDSLNQLRAKKKARIRVAHFGDSAIESDLVTSELRKQYQLAYGGSGFGFIPMASIGPATRISSVHHFSKEWQLLNIKEDNKTESPVGLSGYSSLAPGGAKLESELLSPKNSNTIPFNRIRVFYGPVSGNDEQVLLNDSSLSLSGTALVNELSQPVKGNSVKLKTANKNNLTLYGFSTESDTGIVIDNFSFRGSSGTLFTNFRQNQLRAWDSLMQYDLIILQFGINVAGATSKGYDWYQKKFNENVKYLQKNFPLTPILIVGCGDRAVKKNGIYSSLKGIPALIDVQKQIAEENHCAFVNLYGLMGGEGSMVSWVKNEPALANKDYTHYTHKGAEKVGKLLFDALESEYNAYSNAQVSK